jgi:predicted ATPase
LPASAIRALCSGRQCGAPDERYHSDVIRRLYVHNFRCLENFELPASGQSSMLLIGKNGAGKTAVGLALEILQKIGRGANRVGELVKPGDLSRGRADALNSGPISIGHLMGEIVGRTDLPMRFEIEVELEARLFAYSIAFEFPAGFKELRVLDERLAVDGKPVLTRALDQVGVAGAGPERVASFPIDWHLVALPIIQQQSTSDPAFLFKQWLARMLILRPLPVLITGDSKDETLEPNLQLTDFGAWFSGLLAHAPSAYAKIDEYLRQVMPDLKDIKNPLVGTDSRSLIVQFSNEQGTLKLPFGALSDAEKCFMICALVLAANDAYGPLLCFWDEPDNYLAISEVGHFVLALRKAFQSGGQFIATSHNAEAIRRFSDENTFVLYRNSHLEPTIMRPLKDMQVNGDLVGAMIRDDIQP